MPNIHCHECKVVYDILKGTSGERGFIVTNLTNSEPDLTKIYFCTIDCYAQYITDREFRPTTISTTITTPNGDVKKVVYKPDENEKEEQRKEFFNRRRAELLKTRAVQEYMKRNEFTDRAPVEECERIEETHKEPVRIDTDEDLAWADTA